MLKNLIIVIAALLVLSTNTTFAQNQNNKTLAISAAKSWLNTVDNEKYGDSWDQAASFFRNSISKAQWTQALNATRKPFGKVISRTLKNATPTNSLPGAPDGSYVVIQFNTSFTGKKSSVETITPMLDKDNKWRVSGYFIK